MSTISLQDLALRYGLDVQQAVAFLKDNYETINADHDYATFSRGKWTIDREALAIMDGILGFQEEIPEESVKEEDPELLALREQVESLTDALRNGQQAHEKLQNDYDSLQNKFLQFQEGKEAVNSAMLRKYQTATEQAKKEADALRKRLAGLQEAKEKQYQELTARIEEVTSQLSEQHELLEKQMRAQSAVLTARKQEDKLYKELQNAQAQSADLTDSLEQVKMEKDDVLHQLDSVHLQVAQVMKVLSSAQSQLAACTKPMKDVDVIVSDKKEEAKPLPKKPEPKKIETKTPVQPMNKMREHVLTQKKAEEKSDKKNGTVFHRVASYFGFM